MEQDELVNLYFNKIIRYVDYEMLGSDTRTSMKEQLSVYETCIKNNIRSIIANNNHYLLTDDFMFNLVYSSYRVSLFGLEVTDKLDKLTSDDHETLVKAMTIHFNDIVRLTSNKYGMHHYVASSLSSEYAYLLNTYRKYSDLNWLNYKEYNDYDSKEMIRTSLLTILAQCVIDEKADKYDDYCLYIFNNRSIYLEFLKVKGIDGDCSIIKFLEAYPIDEIINLIDNRESIER